MSQRYDHVIVGAGSSGCALARRLSDDPEVTVALIEAGGLDDREAITSPTEYFKLWGTDVDWGYESVPQQGTKGRVHGMPRGKVLGGTSSINGMVYLRGAREDFDAWAATGLLRLGLGIRRARATTRWSRCSSPTSWATGTRSRRCSSRPPRRPGCRTTRRSTRARSRDRAGIAPRSGTAAATTRSRRSSLPWPTVRT